MFNLEEETHESCLDLVPIFSGLTAAEKDEIMMITHEKKYSRGDVIYSAGEISKSLYVIHQGSVRVYRLSPTGKEQVIRICGPGDFLGELTLFSDQPLTEYAVASSSLAMCVINGQDLTQLMAKYPTIAMKVLEVLSQRLNRAESLIEDINLHSVDYRIANTLLELAQEGTVINLPSTKADLASSLGMTGETLSRKLSALQDAEVIDMRGQRRIYILKREALEAMLDA